MENHAHDQTILLKMNIDCCEACPKKLKKALLTIDGVFSVAICPEKKLVTVTGKVDPKILTESIAKWGKTAEFLGYEIGPKNVHNHGEKNKSKNSKPASDKCPEHGNERKKVHQNGRERNRGNPKDDSPKKEENNHEPEAYVAPKIDEEVCRDPYCKLHKRRPIIHNKVPSIDSADHPHHTRGHFPRRGSEKQFFNLGNHFRYDHPRMAPHPMMEPSLRPPPPPLPGYGLYSGSYYMPRFDDFPYHDNAPNPRGWPFM